MRRLNGIMLYAAMNERGWTNEDLARELKAKGLHVDSRIVQKWCKGKLQPSAEKIVLIEQTLGSVVADEPKPRRVYGRITLTNQTAFA